MSGPIRKLIGPAKSRIQRAIEEAEALLDTVLEEDNLDGDEMKIETLIHRLTSHVAMLEKCNQDWTTVLNNIKSETAKATEEREYSRVADGEDGFIEAIFNGNEVVSRLQARMKIITRKRDAVNRLSVSSQYEVRTAIQEGLSTIRLHSSDQPSLGVLADSQMRLPKLQLPNFDGNILKWPEFWDIFESSVDKQNIPNVSKFSYLRSVLRGPAFVAISGITLSNENYDMAVALLKEKFGNPESIIEALYAKLQHLSTVPNRFSDIKRVHETIERILRQLEAQGENVNSQKILVHQILSKFPLEVMLKLEDIKEYGRAWTVKELRRLLSQYVQVQESAQRRFTNFKGISESRTTRNGDNRQNPPRYWSDNKDGRHQSGVSVETFATNVRGRGKGTFNSLSPCVFCKGQHFNDECDQYKELSDRKQQLLSQGRCFLCLKPGHMFKDCTFAQKNGCYYCGKQRHHNRAICPQKFKNVSQLENENVTLSGSPASVSDSQVHNEERRLQLESINSTSVQTLVSSGEKVLLQTATVPIQSGDGSRTVPVKVLLDSASHRTFMTDRLAKQLQLVSQYKEALSVSTFAGRKPQDVNSYVVKFNLMTKDRCCLQLYANVVEQITGPLQRGPLQSSDLDILLSISPDKLADTIPRNMEPSTVDLLIGSDYFWSIIGTEKTTLPSGLFLVSSKIGYILTGSYSYPTRDETQPTSSLLVMTQVNCAVPTLNWSTPSDMSVTLNPNIEDFWKLETLGIRDPLDLTSDDKALKQFNNSICFVDGRYQITWPWKCEDPDLPDNFHIALNRLRCLTRRLDRDKDLLVRYNEVIQSQVKLGVIEKVVKTNDNTLKHYLPHHPILTPMKNTTKLRIVYDASVKAKKGAKSLNDCLFRGPVLLPDLCGILFRLRLHPIIMLADIEKAFLQVGIQELDRDVTRFLWFKELSDTSVSDGSLDVYRFCRVPFGIVCSPFLLAGTIKFHLKQFDSPVAQLINDNIYVDNVMLGANSVEQAHEIYVESKKIFQKASMNLREWMSNSLELMDRLPDSERAVGNVVKAFGILWNRHYDSLQIRDVGFNEQMVVTTKREVLKVIAGIFDPLGLVTPVTFHGKVFIQELWKEDLTWDEPLSETLTQRWRSIVLKLKLLSTVKVPRFVGSVKDSVCCELAVFCDASKKAYATAVYLRIQYQDVVRVSLVFSKMRLVPVDSGKGKSKKEITLPRLELLAVSIGVRAATFVTKELHIPLLKRTIWTDSTCVLFWLKTDKPLSLFVENRVKEIQKQDDSFCYVPTAQNPADLPTRGLTVSELQQSKLWWNGPEWLTFSQESWPKWDPPQSSIIEEQSEVKIPKVLYEISSVVHHEEIKRQPVCQIDEQRYSSLRKLLRVTCYCLKFIKRKVWDVLSTSHKETVSRKHTLLGRVFNSLSDMQSIHSVDVKLAMLLWVYSVQQYGFQDVLLAIREKSSHCLIRQLGLKVDECGLLRCHGRFLNADMTEDAKYPKLLPRREHFTRLLITEVHLRLIHAGVAHTLAQIREEYWIPQGRVEVKSVLSKCVVCLRQEGPSFRLPSMPPWPKERVSRSSPFQFVGLDYMGPIYVKHETELRKTWVCLFTCLTVRAIHLEWVLDLTAIQFLSCFRRFVSRRGRPDFVISDNAPQFRLVSTVVSQLWRRTFNDKAVLDYMSMEGIKWSFTTALAPWQGGYYERLVGMVKRCLRKCTGKKHFSLDQLITLLAEIEAILNSRPLTYVYEDVASGFTLTPSHFLATNLKLGLRNTGDADCHEDEDFIPSMDSATKLIELWKKGQKRLDLFWKVWQEEYLLSLRERLPLEHKLSRSQSLKCEPKVGSIVVVKDGNVPRSSWKLGKILRLIPSRDSRIRSAEIQLGQSVVSRPINHLYPLELPASGCCTNGDSAETIDAYPRQKTDTKERVVEDDPNRNDDNRCRKASLRAQRAIYNYLNDDCSTVTFCFPREC